MMFPKVDLNCINWVIFIMLLISITFTIKLAYELETISVQIVQSRSRILKACRSHVSNLTPFAVTSADTKQLHRSRNT